MRRDSKSIVQMNISFLSAVLILISCFISCTAGSCLSYGHSCWGAHGKRSGFARALLNPDNRRVVAAAVPSIPDDKLILMRLAGREFIQSPLAARMRARLLAKEQPLLIVPQILDNDNDVAVPLKRSMAMEKLLRDYEVRGVPKAEPRMTEGESSHNLFNSQSRDFNEDSNQALNMGLYKILKKVNEKSK